MSEQSIVLAQDQFTRPADTTAYAAGDQVGVNLTVSDASNATPIVITTSAAHNLADGDAVTVASVGGNTNANGNFKVKVLTSTTFQLVGSAGNAAYTSGGTVAQMFRFATVGVQGGLVTITKARLATNNTTITNGQFRLHLWNDQVSVAVDNAAQPSLYASTLKAIGSIDLTLAVFGGDGAEKTVDSANVIGQLASGSRDIWGTLEALAAYTPLSAQQFTIEIAGKKHYRNF